MEETATYPLTRQGIRDLDQIGSVKKQALAASKSNLPTATGVTAERVLTGCGGVALAMLGLRRGAAMGFIMALAGTGLVWRAVTGHSSLGDTFKASPVRPG